MSVFNTVSGMEDLVLLPGFGFDSALWRRMCEYLRGHIQVNSFDYPGVSSELDLSPVTATLDDWLEMISLSLPERAHYMGWSLGGLVALRLASRYPERVLSVTCLGSSPCLLARDGWPGVSVEHWQPFMDFSDRGRQRAARLLLQLQGDRSCIRELRQYALPVDSVAWQWGLLALQQWDLTDVLGQISVPVCTIFAEQDALLPISVAQAVKVRYPNVCTKTIPLAPHAMLWSHAETCFNIWQEFLYVRS